MNGENRATRLAHDGFGDRPEHHVPPTAQSVRGDDQQIEVLVAGEIGDFFVGVAHLDFAARLNTRRHARLDELKQLLHRIFFALSVGRDCGRSDYSKRQIGRRRRNKRHHVQQTQLGAEVRSQFDGVLERDIRRRAEIGRT